MMRIRPPLEHHRCDLKHASDSCLPELPPQSGKVVKNVRSFKKFFLVSTRHYLTKKYFRSTCMLQQEKRRQIRVAPWFIIHPFSNIAIIVEVTMVLVWMLSLFLDAYSFGFFHSRDRYSDTYRLALITTLDILNFLYIIICFSSGYLNVTTNEIILQPKKIAMNYMSTYLTFDVLGTMPLVRFTKWAVPMSRPTSMTITVTVLKQFRCVRLKTLLEYLRQLTALVKMGDTLHKIICLTIVCLWLLNWSACILYLVPRLENHYNKKYTSDAWVMKANITEARTSWKYIISLHTAMCHFLNAGVGMFPMKEQKDQLVCSMITLTGYFYIAYMTANVLQMVSSSSASESKYEELIHTLNEYSKRKKLPQLLKFRLLLYYENRFQKRYFRESAILSTLSEHLRYEILLHTCKHLFEKLQIFQGLSKVVLGTIIACLKQEVYLPNDVIMKADNPADCMYLVGYGTLALYTVDGLEIMHIEDGDHFGETGLLRPDSDRQVNIIAVETSEIYRLDKHDFFHIVNTYDDFADKIQKVVAQRIEIVGKLQDHLARLRGKHDILNDLRHGKILEKSYKRQNK